MYLAVFVDKSRCETKNSGRYLIFVRELIASFKMRVLNRQRV